MHVAATPINRPYQSLGILQHVLDYASNVYLALRVPYDGCLVLESVLQGSTPLRKEVITLVMFAGFSVVSSAAAIIWEPRDRVRNNRDWRVLRVSRAAISFHERRN
jgi:hypothetical protein